MQLNMSTDYAIRIILYLSTQSGITPSSQVSKKTGISQGYVLKIVRKLTKAGYTKTHPGTQGGVSIGKSPAIITLLDIMQIMEPTIKLSRCLEENQTCSYCIAECCSVRVFYSSLQRELETKLSSITIKHLLDNS